MNEDDVSRQFEGIISHPENLNVGKNAPAMEDAERLNKGFEEHHGYLHDISDRTYHWLNIAKNPENHLECPNCAEPFRKNDQGVIPHHIDALGNVCSDSGEPMSTGHSISQTHAINALTNLATAFGSLQRELGEGNPVGNGGKCKACNKIYPFGPNVQSY